MSTPLKSRIEQDATAEIVRQVAPRLLEKLQEDIHDVACISVHRVAGMLEVSPETVKRLLKERIIHIGPRQQRITLNDLKQVMQLHRTGERPKLKKQIEKHPELFTESKL